MKPGVLVIGAAVAVLSPETARAQAVTGHVETAPGVRLYYERHGSGPQVIIVPGRLFMPEFRALARPDRTLILYDMRNRGASSPVEGGAQLTILHDVADLEAVRKHFGAERFSTIGYSYLGLMVLLYAAEHPERVDRVVQIGPVARKFGTPYPKEWTAGMESLAPDVRERVEALQTAYRALPADTAEDVRCRRLGEVFSYWLVGDPANRTKLPDNCVYENERPARFDRHLGFHFKDIQERDFPKAIFERIAAPTLTVHGVKDRNAPYGSGREWAMTLPNARLVTVPGGAHQVWLDDPEVIEDIDGFLDGRWPERAERITPS